jgi:amino acid adenylation domain-containing protein
MMDVGHVAYAGASAFLDAFAQHRASADSGVVMSINWGAWQDVGGAMELAKKHARALGLSESRAKIENGILSGEGVDVFSRIMQMESSIPQVVVYPQDLIEAVNRSRTLRIGDRGGEKPAPGRGVQRVQRPSLESEYVPAGSDIEKILVETWSEFFGFDRIGIQDDFFELGGDSLKAITMVNKIRGKLDVEIGLNDLFLSPTIAQLAGQISGQLSGSRPRAQGQGRNVIYPAMVQDLANIHQPFPLTHIQAAYLLGRSDQFDIGSISTHLYLEVAVRLDIRRLNESLNKVVTRHPMMRAIVTEEGEQKILEEIPEYKIKTEDLTHMNADEQEKRILAERERMSQQIFDLSRWPLFEIKCMRLSGEQLLLFIDFDMIIADAYSFQIIFRELITFYVYPGHEPGALEFTFRDYVLANRELRNSDIYTADREYWLNKLEDFPPAPALPMICEPSKIENPIFKKIHKFFSEEEWEVLRGVAQKNNITPSVLLCTAYAQVLTYWCNQREFALNLTLFNRYPFHKDVDKIVGNFTSVILLAVDWEPGSTFVEAAARIRQTLINALEHRHYEGVEFIREISRYKNLLSQAVMPVVFNSMIAEGGRKDAGSADEQGREPVEEQGNEQGDEWMDVKMRYVRASQIFLEAHTALKGNQLDVSFLYVEELFDPDVITAMFDHYIGIITALIEGVREYKLQPPERDLLLWENYNKTAGDIPGSLLHRMFTRQAALTPGNIALEYGDDILTYRQLDERSNRVARYLKEQGVGRNHNAAVITTRSFETMINVMGILKAGAAYVPIEPDYPEERRNYIFENSRCRLALEPGIYRRENLERFPAAEVSSGSEPGDLAYVIYTSGSTGRPKGVMITHRQAANTIGDINRKFNVNEADRVMGISSMCFDLAVYDVFGTLSTGARLILIPTQKDVDILIETLEDKKITLWNSVPAILDMVVKNLEEDYVNDYLTRALLSGDWIPLTLPGNVEKHFPNCDVISLGGATEGSIWSIYYPVKEVKSEWKSVPYGYPLVNQTFYVLNFQQELCPAGVPGDLYIGGAGVAEGYMNDEEKTTNAFQVHPLFGRIYKTGDCGVFRRDGFIEFLGRRDSQVKLRGFRIELGEIENALLAYPGIRESLVCVREDNSGARSLVAYLIPENGQFILEDSAASDGFEKEHVLNWEQVFDDVYFENSGIEDLTFNTAGWRSSYTGEPIPLEDMKEWINNTVSRIRYIKGDDVLEIGFGTGMVLFRIAPACKTYVGTDISSEAVDYVKGLLNNMETTIQGVHLINSSADDFSAIGNKRFDTIIINSVVQYFPDIEYLTKVIFNAVTLLKAGGSIFIGDVRNYSLLEVFHTAVALHNQPPESWIDIPKLRQEVRRRSTLSDSELVIDPLYFYALKSHCPGINHVEIRYKWGSGDNELTRFRYDAVLYKGIEINNTPGCRKHWQKDGLNLERVKELLLKEKPGILEVYDVPNGRIERELAAVDIMANGSDIDTVEKLNIEIEKETGNGVHPERFKQPGSEDYEVEILWAGPGKNAYYNIVYVNKSVLAQGGSRFYPCWGDGAGGYKNLSNYANNPLRTRIEKKLLQDIKEHLKRNLPEYMMPSYFLMIDRFPLTANGKIDRKSLPEPQVEVVGETGYEAPANAIEETLAKFWEQILGVENVSANDNFFDLGGDSLKATTLVSRARKAFQVKIPLVEVFRLQRLRELADYIKGKELEGYIPIEYAEKKEFYELSSAQKRLYVLHRLYPDSIGYNISQAFNIEGEVDLRKLEETFHLLISRHEVLRTSIKVVDDIPVQEILDDVKFEIRVHEVEESGVQGILTDFIRPFDLSRAPLMRVGLIRISPGSAGTPGSRHTLLVDIHHIVTDAVSLTIFMKDFSAAYSGEELPPITFQYKDYAEWQNRERESGALKRQEEYWLREFAGEIPLLHMPTDYPRPRAAAFDAAIVTFTIDRKQTEMLKSLATREEATVFIVLLAVYTLWLAKLSGQEDIIVGVPIAGRRHPALEKIMGMFINTLAMRNYPLAEMPFVQFLGEVKRRSLGAFENQDYQFEDLVNKLTLTKDPGRSPVFDAMFDFLNVDAPRESGAPGESTPRGYRKYTANFDLRLMGVEDGGQLVFSLKYRTALYKKETMERFVEYFKNIISAVLKNSREKPADMGITSGEERNRILYGFNNTYMDFPGDKRIHQQVEQGVEKHPDKIVLVGPVQGTVQLTCRELNERANRLAGYLSRIGIREDRTAAVLLDRSPWMVESILATWKAGGAYIPLDTGYPERRILEIMNDSGTEVLITRSEYVEPAFAKEYRGIIIEVDKEKPAGAQGGGPGNPGPGIDMSSLAYVIYTSGSTGKPKGAMVEHKGMMNHIWAKIHDLQLTAQSIVAQNAAQTFDISVWQLFSAPAVGGQTVIYPDDAVLDPGYIITRLIRDRVTILEVVPSYLAVLLDELGEQGTPPLSLHYLLVTGEEVKPALVAKWFDHYPGIKMVNAYGPTEASDDITHHIMGSAPGGERIPIGKTLYNLGIYIVDKNMKPCPVGVKGEIWVSGIGVGRGYLNDVNRTADGFMEDPFARQEGIRLYKTGDLGRRLPDGTIEFFGRKDYQVKIRGFRIELGEIESKLAAYPQAGDVVVVDREDERGNKYLCAYVVMAGGGAFNTGDIKKWLLERVPDYMVPGHFVQLERMPLTPNGKIDRKALPEPVRGSHAVVKYISPGVLGSIKEAGGDKRPRVFPMTAPGKFLDSAAGRLEKEKSLLADYSRKTGKDYYLLSYPQKMIYFIEKKHSGTGCNNIVFFIRYPEAVDSNLLEEAINKVIFKHRALRLRMAEVEHESGIIPAQYPTAYRKVTIDRLDFSAGEDSEARVQGWLRKKGAGAFDFFDSDLFYFAYVKIHERESGCYMKIHNIVSDGLTFHILIKEIKRIYRDLKAGKRVDIKEAPSYLDFIADELAYFKSARARSDMKFYLEDMLPPPGEVTLSSGVIGSDSANVDADCIILGIPADLRRKIHEYRKRTKSSLYKIMLSALSIYIFRALGRDDVIIGSLVNNRSHFKYIKTAGIFIHFLPLRLRIDGNMDFNGFVEKTGRYLDDIIANRQGYPFEILAGQLRECFGVDPGYFYNINLIGYPDLEDVVMERPFAGFEEAPFSLYVNRYNRDIHGVLEFEWIFRRGLFTGEEIRQIHGRLENILHDGLDNPGKKLTEIGYLSPGETGLPVGGGEPLWVRGVRVDAGEIEKALLGYNGIKEAAVVTAAADEYGNMNRPLCGFVVSEHTPGRAALQEYLSLKLPAHLVPSHFFRLEEMPLTDDGKVDRALLSAVKPEAGPGKDHEEPRDRLESGLRTLWAEVMGVAEGDIGVNRSFFDLGGHSLTAIMLTAKIHKVFNVKLPLAQVFRTPTVRGLAGFLRTAATSEFVSIEVVEEREYYVLSSAQKRLYILQRMDSENIGYNLPFIVTLQVDLDIERFEDSLKKLISRHDSLRTSFGVIDDEPVQKIHRGVEFEIEYYDFIDAGQSKKVIDDVIKNFVRPFDLAKPPLLRVGLIKIEKGKYIFMKDMHHIISDDISMGVFTGEAMALYAGEEVPPLKFRYKDYSQWQDYLFNSGVMKEQEAYWLKQFEEKIPEADLPCDYERSRHIGYRGDIVGAEIGAFATGRLREIAGGKGATLNMLLLTVFAVLLSKYTDQEDIVIGIPVSGRIHHDLGYIIGNFVNMLALRTYPHYRKRFIDLLEEVRECSIKAFDNQAYQFDTLIEKLKLKRELDRHPLFDTVFQFTSAAAPGMEEGQPGMGIEDPVIKPYQRDDNPVTSRFDLSLNAVELNDKISCKFRYRSQLFKRSTIERMSLVFEKIVEQVINEPGVELFNIEIIDDDEIKEKETVDLDAGSVKFNF